MKTAHILYPSYFANAVPSKIVNFHLEKIVKNPRWELYWGCFYTRSKGMKRRSHTLMIWCIYLITPSSFAVGRQFSLKAGKFRESWNILVWRRVIDAVLLNSSALLSALSLACFNSKSWKWLSRNDNASNCMASSNRACLKNVKYTELMPKLNKCAFNSKS